MIAKLENLRSTEQAIWASNDVVISDQGIMRGFEAKQSILCIPTNVWGFVYVLPSDVDFACVPPTYSFILYRPASLVLHAQLGVDFVLRRMTQGDAQYWYRAHKDGNVKRMRLMRVGKKKNGAW